MEAAEPLLASGRHRTRPEQRSPALALLGERVRPVVPSSDQVLDVPDPLGRALPGRGLRRGSVVTVEGALGAGATSVALALSGAVTGAGEWVAWVDDASLGALAADEAGVSLERLVVVRDVPSSRWPTVVAALLEGVSLVVAAPAGRVGRADARRLAARARERRSILAVAGRWPERAAFRVTAVGTAWRFERGRLVPGPGHVEVEHRGTPRRGHALAGG